jgi:hypothetical protein
MMARGRKSINREHATVPTIVPVSGQNGPFRDNGTGRDGGEHLGNRAPVLFIAASGTAERY